MKTLVISKPIYDYILPLVEFPVDGDKFFIDNSVKTVSNIGTLTAITLAKLGIDVSFTGMIGEDENGRKIKNLLESYNIDTKYIEISFNENTCANYKIYNGKSNKFTTITEKSLKTNLTKYKYDFSPDVIVMDDGDYSANLAAINNFPNSKLIYIGEKFSKDSIIYCNKCNYVITNLSFASALTGVTNNLNKPKSIVQIFQKFIDIHNANLIIKLDNFDVLYCINDEVRLIKNVNKNIANKNDLYNSILTYFLTISDDVENSIKLTNKVMLETTNDLDMLKNIPEYNTIKNIMETVQNNINNKEGNSKTNVTTNIQNNENVITENNPINATMSNNIETNTIVNKEPEENKIEEPIKETSKEINVLETTKLDDQIVNQNMNNGVNEIEKL